MGLSQRQGALLGACICIVANTLISLALNVQKLAHVRMQGKVGGGEDGERQRDVEQGKAMDAQRALPAQRDDDEGDGGGGQGAADEGPGQPNTRFLRSKLWWSGIGLMLLGEMGNFVSYGFAPASLVAPLGSVALLANVFLAPLLLKERFATSDLFGVFLATVGAAGVVAACSTGRGEGGPGGPDALWEAVKERNFLVFTLVMIVLGGALVALSPTRWGERYVLVDVGACAVFGGFTVLSTKGISSLLSYGASRRDILSALRSPISYACVLILLGTALVQITFLNRALQRFDARKVIPSQFVLFTIFSISGSAVLFRDFERADAAHLIGFLAGCTTTFAGVFVLTRRKSDEGGDGKGEDEDAEGSEVQTAQADTAPCKEQASRGRGRRGDVGTAEEHQSLLPPSTPVRHLDHSSSGRHGYARNRPAALSSSATTGSVPTYSTTLTVSPSRAAAAVLPIRKPRHPSSSSVSSPSAAAATAGGASSASPSRHSSRAAVGMGFLSKPQLSLVRGSSVTGAGGYLLLLSGPGSVGMVGTPSSVPNSTYTPGEHRTPAAGAGTGLSGSSTAVRPGLASTSSSPITRTTVGLSVSPGRALLLSSSGGGGGGPSQPWSDRGHTSFGSPTPTRNNPPHRGPSTTAGIKGSVENEEWKLKSSREAPPARSAGTDTAATLTPTPTPTPTAVASCSSTISPSRIPALSSRTTIEVIPRVGRESGEEITGKDDQESQPDVHE